MGHQARRHRSMRWAAAAALVLGVVVGTSAVASAKAAKGSTQWCAHHVKKCAAGGSGTGSGTGGTPPELTIQIDPNPVVETATSAVAVVVQVEADPAFAGDPVDVSSSQLDAACALAVGFNAQPLFELGPPLTLTLTLDDDGNATVAIIGQDCAPGSDLVEASMAVAPFLTATDVLDVSPPQVTPAGVYGSPTTSGSVAGEVETGDTVTSGDSDVAAVFNIETDPVYAEQPVEIDWNELQSRCLRAEGYRPHRPQLRRHRCWSRAGSSSRILRRRSMTTGTPRSSSSDRPAPRVRRTSSPTSWPARIRPTRRPSPSTRRR